MTLLQGRAQVLRQKDALDRAFARANSIAIDNYELRSDLAKHLCILISGWLEAAAYELARQRCRKHSSGPVLSYCLSQLSWTRNPNADALLELVGFFDLAWQDAFEKTLTLERKSAVNSIVGLRNDIAHGKLQGTSSMSIVRVRAYYERVAEVVDYLMDLFDPVGN